MLVLIACLHALICRFFCLFFSQFSTPCEHYVVPATFSKAMDTIFLLHADHEQNASTSTVRIAGSSEANPYACVASGIASLWGPMHGGANEAHIRDPSLLLIP